MSTARKLKVGALKVSNETVRKYLINVYKPEFRPKLNHLTKFLSVDFWDRHGCKRAKDESLNSVLQDDHYSRESPEF